MESESTEKELFRTDAAVIAISDDHIIALHYYEDVVVSLKNLKEIAGLVKQISEEYENCTLLTIGGTYTGIEEDARQFGNRHAFPVLAEAFVMRSLAHRILANFLMRLRLKPYPVRAFTDEQSARNWLLEQKKSRMPKMTA